jgi:hypothetical protein
LRLHAWHERVQSIAEFCDRIDPFVAQSVIECEPAGDTPFILSVERQIPVA